MFFNKFFILSSTSKSRIKIFKEVGLNFRHVKPNCNENYYKKKLEKLKTKPKKVSLELAKAKAISISKNKKNSLVVGSDTVISFNGQLIKKAKNIKEAKNKIKKLSGKKHIIISSAVAYFNSKCVWSSTEETSVKIRKLNQNEINEYVKFCGKTILESVGCYQLEKKGPIIVDRINGDFFNVLGFPLFPFLKFLNQTGEEKNTK